MGLFDWFAGKSKVEIANERIWLTREAKIAGIQKEVAEAIADTEGPNAIVVAGYFNDCLEQLQAAVGGFDPDRVLVACADALAGRMPTDVVTDESRSILIIVGERHPLPAHNEGVKDFARSLPCRSRIVYHASLEDPLLKRFAGDWVQSVLRKLGMKEDEAIESRMVTRRIQTELNKVATCATGDVPANSAEEWMEKNCR